MGKSDKTDDALPESERESSEVDVAEASRLLFVSRPYVRELVASGKLPVARVAEDGDVWIARAEVMAYRERMRAAMKAGLDKMTEAGDRMGSWGEEFDGIPTRNKPGVK